MNLKKHAMLAGFLVSAVCMEYDCLAMNGKDNLFGNINGSNQTENRMVTENNANNGTIVIADFGGGTVEVVGVIDNTRHNATAIPTANTNMGHDRLAMKKKKGKSFTVIDMSNGNRYEHTLNDGIYGNNNENMFSFSLNNNGRQTKAEEAWRITIDFLMIIGKYFKTNKDYINVMKVNKKYEELVLMYKFNPISDISLFEKIETQHLYSKEDVKSKKEGMFQYIHWFDVDCETFRNKKNNEIYKNVILTGKNVKELVLIKDEKLLVPECVIEIADCCFNDWASGEFSTGKAATSAPFTTAQLSCRLRKIGYAAVAGTKIISIDVPEGVKEIGDYCFCECKTLSTIKLPSTLEKIGDYAFSYNASQSITIPKGVKEIGENCFEGCDNLTEINVVLGEKAENMAVYNKLKAEYPDKVKLVDINGNVINGDF